MHSTASPPSRSGRLAGRTCRLSYIVPSLDLPLSTTTSNTGQIANMHKQIELQPRLEMRAQFVLLRAMDSSKLRHGLWHPQLAWPDPKAHSRPRANTILKHIRCQKHEIVGGCRRRFYPEVADGMDTFVSLYHLAFAIVDSYITVLCTIARRLHEAPLLCCSLKAGITQSFEVNTNFSLDSG